MLDVRVCLQMMEQLTDHHYDVLTVPEELAANCIYIKGLSKRDFLLHRPADECPDSVSVSTTEGFFLFFFLINCTLLQYNVMFMYVLIAINKFSCNLLFSLCYSLTDFFFLLLWQFFWLLSPCCIN